MSAIDHHSMSRRIVVDVFAGFSKLERCGVSHIFMLTAFWPFFAGCQSIQSPTTQRSSRCEAFCTRAIEARESGDAESANRYINEAVREKPSDIETRRQLAEAMWNNGRRLEAVSQVVSISRERPKDAKVLARLTMMQWEMNQHSAAAKTALAVLRLDPESKEGWLIKARNETANGQLDDALVSYIRLSQIAPDDLSTLTELGQLHLKRGHPDRACPLFLSAIHHPQATQEQQLEIEWQLGVAYAQCERWLVAVNVLEQAMIRRTGSAEDWSFIGWTRLQTGDYTGAQADLQRALQIDPTSEAARILARQLDTTANSQPADNRVTPVNHQRKT